MTILLSTLAVAFAAICVWLTVRIMNRRERWAKSTLAVVVTLPVLYVASFGPACWYASYYEQPKRAFGGDGDDLSDGLVKIIGVAYIPLGRIAVDGPDIVARPLSKYASVEVPDDEIPFVPYNNSTWHGVRR